MKIVWLMFFSHTLFGGEIFGVDEFSLQLVMIFLIAIAVGIVIKFLKNKGVEYETTTIRKVKIPNSDEGTSKTQKSISSKNQNLKNDVEKLKEEYASLEESKTLEEERKKLKKELLLHKGIKNMLVIDGLLYQNHTFTKTYTFEEAQSYAQNLHLNDIKNWRLPTIKELKNIAHIEIPIFKKNEPLWKSLYKQNKEKRVTTPLGYQQFMQNEFLPNMPKNACFWSSQEEDALSAWSVNFSKGKDERYHKEGSYYLLCVSEV